LLLVLPALSSSTNGNNLQQYLKNEADLLDLITRGSIHDKNNNLWLFMLPAALLFFSALVII
jgi:hypothetical protein